MESVITLAFSESVDASALSQLYFFSWTHRMWKCCLSKTAHQRYHTDWWCSNCWFTTELWCELYKGWNYGLYEWDKFINRQYYKKLIRWSFGRCYQWSCWQPLQAGPHLQASLVDDGQNQTRTQFLSLTLKLDRWLLHLMMWFNMWLMLIHSTLLHSQSKMSHHELAYHIKYHIKYYLKPQWLHHHSGYLSTGLTEYWTHARSGRVHQLNLPHHASLCHWGHCTSRLLMEKLCKLLNMWLIMHLQCSWALIWVSMPLS